MSLITQQQMAEKIRQHRDPHQPLTLSNLELSDAIVIPLVSILNSNPMVNILDLSFNIITNAGAAALAKLKHVNHLNLRANQVGNKGVCAFYSNQQLTHLILDLNMHVNDKTALSLAKETQLLEIKLLACSVSPATRVLISKIIQDKLKGNIAVNDAIHKAQRESLFLDILS